MTAARELRLAQRALRTAATHLVQATRLGGPAGAALYGKLEPWWMMLCHRATDLNGIIQDVQAADSARRRARRDAARRVA